MFKRGDRICIGVALASYYGYVSQTYNMAGRLPKEFQQAFQPVTGHVSSGWSSSRISAICRHCLQRRSSQPQGGRPIGCVAGFIAPALPDDGAEAGAERS